MRRTQQEIDAGLSRTLAAWDGRRIEEYARKFSEAERAKLAKEHKALPDGSYPIPDEASLRDAETLAKSGHGDVKGAQALIRRRAKELGVKHNLGGSEKAAANAAANSAVRKAIEDAIALQLKDPDVKTHEADRQVLDALHQALQAQLRDEAQDAEPMEPAEPQAA